MGSLAL